MIYKFKSINKNKILSIQNILDRDLSFKCNFKYKLKIKKFAPLYFIEKIYIQEVIKKNSTLTNVAKILKISRSTLYKKIKKYNIKVSKIKKRTDV